MAKKTTFTFTTADGETATRTSARAYTHVIVGRYNRAQARASVESVKSREMFADQWKYRAKLLSVAVGETYPGSRWAVTQGDQDKACVVLNEFPTVESYVEAQIAKECAKIGEGDAGPPRIHEAGSCKSRIRQGPEDVQKDRAVRAAVQLT